MRRNRRSFVPSVEGLAIRIMPTDIVGGTGTTETNPMPPTEGPLDTMPPSGTPIDPSDTPLPPGSTGNGTP